MRICLAVAVILALGMQANAQDIGQNCAAKADAKGLYGQERIRFEARCKAGVAATWPTVPPWAASKPKVRPPDSEVINANGELGRDQHNGHYAHCLSNSTIIGACPLCVAFLWLFEDDRHCYVY
jgi:hypothetical protein